MAERLPERPDILNVGRMAGFTRETLVSGGADRRDCLPRRVWAGIEVILAVDRCIHSCVVGCQTRHILGILGRLFGVPSMPSMCRERRRTMELPGQAAHR